MADLAVLVPVLDRPHRVQPLLESVARSTPDAHLTFVCDPDDHGEIAAIRTFTQDEPPAVRTSLLIEGGSYAHKINVALASGNEPLVFLGADDLDFQPGWFEKAASHISEGAEVVGVNDMIPRPRRPEHATHFLLTRDYAESPTIDGTPGPLCEAYAHACVDDELIATATKRGVYVYARNSWVRHLHPTAQTAPLDDTYRKGMSAIPADRVLFRKREALWT